MTFNCEFCLIDKCILELAHKRGSVTPNTANLLCEASNQFAFFDRVPILILQLLFEYQLLLLHYLSLLLLSLLLLLHFLLSLLLLELLELIQTQGRVRIRKQVATLLHHRIHYCISHLCLVALIQWVFIKLV